MVRMPCDAASLVTLIDGIIKTLRRSTRTMPTSSLFIRMKMAIGSVRTPLKALRAEIAAGHGNPTAQWLDAAWLVLSALQVPINEIDARLRTEREKWFHWVRKLDWKPSRDEIETFDHQLWTFMKLLDNLHSALNQCVSLVLPASGSNAHSLELSRKD